jgi:mannosylglucosylglycerate synthase
MSGHRAHRIGFVSTRFAGTDGVSLEAAKWETVVRELGHEVFHFAGELDRPLERSRLVPEAFYRHPDVAAINDTVYGPSLETAVEAEREGHLPHRHDFFSPYVRPPDIARRINALTAHLRDELAAFCRDFDIELLVVENALAIPINLPLGLAITEFVAETGMPVVAHHHDLPWERQRFAVNSVADLIAAAFPPPLPSVRHVVINSLQAQQLAWRTGLASRLIPNVMDFDTPPPPLDDYGRGARRDLGVGDDELLILQPTRIIQRKGIEHAIELTRRIGRPARLVISHAAGDEGTDYEQRVREFARLLEVDVRFESDIVGTERAVLADGRRVYTLADLYPHADLVTYGSSIEGFGNAFLEAVYHRRPIVVNRYSIYEIDIQPKGFRAIEFDSFISERTLEEVRTLLDRRDMAEEWAEVNVELAQRHFSYGVLRRRLDALLLECFGDEP